MVCLAPARQIRAKKPSQIYYDQFGNPTSELLPQYKDEVDDKVRALLFFFLAFFVSFGWSASHLV